MENNKIDELKLIELKELVNKTVFEMREQHPGMTMGDLQTIAVFTQMLYENIHEEYFNGE